MQLKAIVTGANGMLGDSLCPLLVNKGYNIAATDIAANTNIFKLDIRNLDEAMNFIKKQKPSIIFHLAAETDVDKCELNENHAYETNAKGTENIAMCCKKLDIPMVYISTGAVFDGEKEGGYTEEDVTSPVNIYGRSKLEGEKTVKSLLSKYYIIRAGWMIGGHDKDKKFVWKIVELLKTKKEISAVTDKFGTPTFTKDLSKGIYDIVVKGQYGLYHSVNNGGICTRFDIAEKIIEYLNKKDVILKSVDSNAFPMPAPRPKSEALINYKLSSMGMNSMRTWQEALKEYIEEIK
jgi:dTDP-4-dehydrorhamnose reductase